MIGIFFVWFRVVWFSLVRFGLVWFGVVMCRRLIGSVRFDSVRFGSVRFGSVRKNMFARFDTVRPAFFGRVVARSGSVRFVSASGSGRLRN